MDRNSYFSTTSRHKEAVLRERVMHYVLHEFFANGADVLRQSGREHHDLFVVRCLHKDGLNIPPHVCNGGPLH